MYFQHCRKFFPGFFLPHAPLLSLNFFPLTQVLNYDKWNINYQKNLC